MKWEPQAVPQDPEVAQRGRPCPEVMEAAVRRNITSILHFTRIGGLKGILRTSSVKARRYLREDERVKYVYEDNAIDRSRDLPWHGYVSLSVTDINLSMFRSSKDWHPNDEWVILEFGPAILADPGVVFCTTNNAYDNVRRCAGIKGFEQMFAPMVPWGHFGTVDNRQGQGRAHNQTTNPQAEILYPFELSLDHLHTITVADEDTYDAAKDIIHYFPHQAHVAIKPEAFR